MISSVSFKFCPFCGGEMPKRSMMKFCLFCGKELLINDNKKIEIHKNIVTPEKIQLKNIELENENLYEIYITDTYYKVFAQKINENEYYSIMLKYAINAEKLVDSLKKVLLRGSFAIHLAVDNMPSLIIYKAKKEDIKSIVELFIENQASISIIPGEFNDKPTIQELFPKFKKLSSQIQQDLRKVPINLWIGDSIGSVFSAIYRENKEAILVVSDKNIYILYKNTNAAEYRWLVISYILLAKVIGQDNSLQFIYKDKEIEGVELVNKLELAEAVQMIKEYILSAP